MIGSLVKSELVATLRTLALSLWILTAGCGGSTPDPRPMPGPPKLSAKQVGKAFYVTEHPKGGALPQDETGALAQPKITDDFRLPVTTNDWWTSLIWQWDKDNPYSEPMYAHPLAMQAEAGGLGLSYPTKLVTDHMRYMYLHDQDLLVGIQNLRSADTKVASYSDWGVTAHWSGRGRSMRATFAHGLPFTYFTREGSDAAQVRIPQTKELKIWSNAGGVAGLTVRAEGEDHHYGLFGPTASEWSVEGKALTNSLDGKDYWSVAVLPNADAETLELFRRHAYAFVTDTRVSWTYNEEAATVRTRFEFVSEQKESAEGMRPHPILALYRHQWVNCNAPYLADTYHSPRGKMKLLSAAAFTTEVRWHGVLPIMPHVVGDEGVLPDDDFEAGRLERYVDEVYQAEELFPKGLTPVPMRDTYWIGKSLGKHSGVLQIADQIGRHAARDHLIQALKNELQDWFDGRAPHHFYYNELWKTLIGYPDSYMSSGQMNDHHFHYAYFIMSAAIIARFDPVWAEQWGDFIDLLIADPANWDRQDTRFPFLRQMDPYAGHSWANGPSLFKEGNNQEASSEDTNFSTALILWGAMTGKKHIRDLGIFLHANQVEAIKQYWFDVDGAVIPEAFDKVTLAMVWGAGGWYNTWFDEDPNVLHGINYLPLSGGSLYHGRWPQYVKKNFSALHKVNKGEIWTWRDLIIMYRALAEPEAAVKMFEADPHYRPEFGNTRATIMHWVYNLRALGSVDTEVTADIATFSVFMKDGRRTYVAFNPERDEKTVTFSDGKQFKVPAGKTRSVVAPAP